MPNVIDRSRAEALIREQVVSTIFQDAPKQSVVMQLGRKLPNMTSKQTRIPVLSMLPLAYWVNGDTGYGIHSPSTEAKSWGAYISQGLLDGLASKWENITSWLRDLKQNFVDAWDNIRAKTTETFNSLGQTISDIWNGISSTIKTAVNGIIGFINRMISAVVTGINAVINALNGLSFDLPDIFGGGHVGFNISTLTAPQIPYLAQGAVIPANREFLAVLGDQSHGTNVEAPLDTIKQAVAEVMEDLQAGQMAGFEAVVSVLREILSAVYGIELTDEDVGRAVQRWQRKQAIATGGV